MRIPLVLMTLALSTPALAEPLKKDADSTQEMQRVLNDPAMADRLGGMMEAMSKAFLDLPVGQIEAAAQGRAPTVADKRRTIRDMGRRDDPNFDANFKRQIAEARPMIQTSMKAMARALPAMQKAMGEMAKELEEAAANMPSPTYPKR